MASKAQDPGSGRRGGLFDSVKVLAATLLAIAHTRLELLSTEVEEERVRLSSILGCRPASTRHWGAQLPCIAAIGFNLVGGAMRQTGYGQHTDLAATDLGPERRVFRNPPWHGRSGPASS